jgi:predicted RNA binding protein YcfA (HicA-like mRNA interferase family)
MGKQRPVSGENVVAALARLGFARVSQKGSHVKVRNAEGRTAIVPMHREIAFGTLRSILRHAGISMDDLALVL